MLLPSSGSLSWPRRQPSLRCSRRSTSTTERSSGRGCAALQWHPDLKWTDQAVSLAGLIRGKSGFFGGLLRESATNSSKTLLRKRFLQLQHPSRRGVGWQAIKVDRSDQVSFANPPERQPWGVGVQKAIAWPSTFGSSAQGAQVVIKYITLE